MEKFITIEQLRNEAMETLKNGSWLTTVKYKEREVTMDCEGCYSCTSYNPFDPEFITKDINDAIDYLYPQ